MCFSSTTINKQIAFDCDLVDVYRVMFVAFCFLTMLGTRVMVTKGNVSHTESKREKSVSESREVVGHVVAERARQQFQILLWNILECLPWYDSD